MVNNTIDNRMNNNTNNNIDFKDLLNPISIMEHITKLKETTIMDHETVLNNLLLQVEPIDFRSLAFPFLSDLMNQQKLYSTDSDEFRTIQNKIDKCKLNDKHYLVYSIDNLLELSLTNNWGLCKRNGNIYLYNGAFWKELDEDQFKGFLRNASIRMGITESTAKYYDFNDKLFKQFMSSALLKEIKRDRETVSINLLNGTLNISSKGIFLNQFESSDFLTYQLSFNYDKNAQALRFQKYLDTVLPDKNAQKILAEFLGLIFIKNGSKLIKEEKTLLLYGSGANGKSVFFEVVNALLGESNITNFSLSNLTNENGYSRAKIEGKLLNYASEISGKLDPTVFKQLVSGEPVEARAPYKEPMIIRDYARLMFNCNELPSDVEFTNGFYRRFLIIPFEVTIPSHKQDKELHNKIIANELPGVLNWVLDGLDRLLSQKGFTQSDIIDRALDNYKIQSNSARLFLEEKSYVPSIDNEFQLVSAIYREYTNFCFEENMEPIKSKDFEKQLNMAKIRTKRQAGKGTRIAYIKTVDYVPENTI